ncbi:MAG: CapA family protein, partial [Microbacteriaceae bacterium]
MRIAPLAVLTLGALLLGGCAVPGETSQGPSQEPSGESVPASATIEPINRSDFVRIRIAAMGDMLPHGGVNLSAKSGSGFNYEQFFAKIRHIYADADVVYCNQESPTANGLPISDYPRFNATADFAKGLQKAGCNAINLANNHTFDKNQVGVDQTRALWEQLNPLLLVGANRSAEEQRKVSYAEVDGVTVALLGYSMLSNMGRLTTYGLNHTDDEALVRAQIAEAKEKADLVMVSMHWGEEYVSKANATQKNYARFLADLGVDVIIGMHAHVIQEAEWLERPDGGRTLVWYSLGNLLSAQVTLDQRTGGVALFDVLVGGERSIIVEPTFVPSYTYFPYSYNAARDVYVAGKGLEIRPLWEAQS